MPVDDAATGDPLGEQRRAASYELGGQLLHLFDGLPPEHDAGMAEKFVEVLLPPRESRFRGGAGVDRSAPHRTGVEQRQLFGNRYQVVLDRLAVPHQRRQSSAVRIPAHHDHRLGPTMLRASEMSDTKITVGSEPTVQEHLMHTGAFTQFRRSEVEEVGDHRLLRLIGLVTDENHDASVGFVNLGR
jgi:hypothetical protein